MQSKGEMGVYLLALARRIWSKMEGRRMEWRREGCAWGHGWWRPLVAIGYYGEEDAESTRVAELVPKKGLTEKGLTLGCSN